MVISLNAGVGVTNAINVRTNHGVRNVSYLGDRIGGRIGVRAKGGIVRAAVGATVRALDSYS